MRKILIILSLITLFLVAYFLLKSPRPIAVAFYYWQSAYRVTGDEAPRYIKVLDVSYNEHLEYRETIFSKRPTHEVVPTIYLDNNIWSKMRAETMTDKILTSLEKSLLNYNEIQVDCDWTGGTKERYFEFLNLLKERSHKRLSVTIRLHQVKYYKKTGVPPVDYGVLMYYNMSEVENIHTKNYILDLEVAKKYHHNFDTYPLPLNLALPLYSQATLIRFSQVAGLIEGIRERELSENFNKIAPHLYGINQTHYFKKRLFYKGDKIRIDEVSPILLKKSVELLSDVMIRPKEVIFYRWANRDHYNEQNLKDIVESW